MAEMGPGLPHGTNPWAEGPREDEEGDATVNHLNAPYTSDQGPPDPLPGGTDEKKILAVIA